MPSAGFENAIPAAKQLQNYALDLAATEIALKFLLDLNFTFFYLHMVLHKIK
jgi:hypothetical protein